MIQHINENTLSLLEKNVCHELMDLFKSPFNSVLMDRIYKMSCNASCSHSGDHEFRDTLTQYGVLVKDLTNIYTNASFECCEDKIAKITHCIAQNMNVNLSHGFKKRNFIDPDLDFD
jgi:hypothetical protein